jgi:NADH dehydrogenase
MAARLSSTPQPMFSFNDKGSLVSLSRNQAVGELLGDVSVQGFIAKTMYVSFIDYIKPTFTATHKQAC